MKQIFIMLSLLFVLNSALQAEEIKSFDIATGVKVFLKKESKTEQRTTQKDKTQAHQNRTYIGGKYYIDIYKLTTTTGDIIWSKKLTYPESFMKLRSSQIEVFAVKKFNGNIYVFYSYNMNVWLDDIKFENDSYSSPKSFKIIPYASFDFIDELKILQSSAGLDIEIKLYESKKRKFRYSNEKLVSVRE